MGAQTPSGIRVGLRFRRKDAPMLRFFADRVKRGEVPGQVGMYEGAAQAAERGEAWAVLCAHPDEAQQMADLFVLLGVERPAVEALVQQSSRR